MLILHLEFNLLGLLESFIVFFLEGEKYIDEAFLIIPLLIGLFYWNSHYLIPKFLKRDSWWKYIIILCVSFLIFFYSGVFVYKMFFENGYQSGFDDVIDYFDHSLILHLIVIGISTSLGISKIALQNATQKAVAEEKQKEAELKYLRNQFNPHFLFNTLNALYSLSTEEEATKTTEAILKLSEIMRYPINQGLKNKVALKDEILFIENYVALQKLRLGDDYPIIFQKEGDFTDLKIMPLCLIPIVENTFKYGISQRDKPSIYFSIKANNDSIQFLSKNRIIGENNANSHQIGIENLKLRLDIVYNSKYSLNLNKMQNDYSVELILKSN